MELSDRKKRILKAIVEEYIEHAEPVGSKSLASIMEASVSPATLRNEMGELEELGFLEKPHTSAGRVPSQNGYRMYVDELMNSYQMTLEEIDALNDMLRIKMSKLDKIVARSGKIISELTNRPAVSMAVPTDKIVIRRFEFVPVDEYSFVLIIVTREGLVRNKFVRLNQPVSAESAAALARLFNSFLSGTSLDEAAYEKLELLQKMAGAASDLAVRMGEFLQYTISELSDSEVFLEGASKFLSYPEFHDPDKAREILDFLSDSRNVRKIPLSDVHDAIGAIIGDETAARELRDASVMYTTYKLPGGMCGIVAVLGPTRMNYAKTAAQLDAFRKKICGIFPDPIGAQPDDPEESDDQSGQPDGGIL